jgi:hypothetical protein
MRLKVGESNLGFSAQGMHCDSGRNVRLGGSVGDLEVDFEGEVIDVVGMMEEGGDGKGEMGKGEGRDLRVAMGEEGGGMMEEGGDGRPEMER